MLRAPTTSCTAAPRVERCRTDRHHEVTLEQYVAEVTDVVIGLERVGSNLVHLDLSHATDLHRDLPEAEAESDTGSAYCV